MATLIKQQMYNMDDGSTKVTEPMMSSLLDVAMALTPTIKIGELYGMIEGRMASSMAAVCRGEKGATILNHIKNIPVRYTHEGDKLVKIEALDVVWYLRDLFGPDKDHLHLENNCSQARARATACMWAERHHHQDVFEMMMELSEIKLHDNPTDEDICRLYWDALTTAGRTYNGPDTTIDMPFNWCGRKLIIQIEHTEPGRKFVVSSSIPQLSFRTNIDMSFMFPSIKNIHDYIKVETAEDESFSAH